MSFSDKIAVLRKKTLLTQSEFAKEINVSFTTVNRWENGKAIPNYSTMKRIKEFCINRDISYEELEEAWIGKV